MRTTGSSMDSRRRKKRALLLQFASSDKPLGTFEGYNSQKEAQERLLKAVAITTSSP